MQLGSMITRDGGTAFVRENDQEKRVSSSGKKIKKDDDLRKITFMKRRRSSRARAHACNVVVIRREKYHKGCRPLFTTTALGALFAPLSCNRRSGSRYKLTVAQ